MDDGSEAKTVYEACLFEENTANYGGAYYAFSKTQGIFYNSHFIHNVARSSGGAVFHAATTNGTYVGCTFANNTAVNGAGIDARANSMFTLQRTTFRSNFATSGTVQVGDSASGTIDGSSFIQNYASENAAGFMSTSSDTRCRISRSYFEGNIAKRVGGALSLHETSHTVRIEYTTFKDNRAGLYGGAYFVRKAVQTLGYGKSHAKNIIFACNFSNSAAYYGGGVYMEPRLGSMGPPRIELINTIFKSNVALTEVQYIARAMGVLC